MSSPPIGSREQRMEPVMSTHSTEAEVLPVGKSSELFSHTQWTTGLWIRVDDSFIPRYTTDDLLRKFAVVTLQLGTPLELRHDAERGWVASISDRERSLYWRGDDVNVQAGLADLAIKMSFMPEGRHLLAEANQ